MRFVAAGCGGLSVFYTLVGVVTLVVLVILLREVDLLDQGQPVSSVGVVPLVNAGARLTVQIVRVSISLSIAGRLFSVGSLLSVGSIAHLAVGVLERILKWLELLFRVIYCFLHVVLLSLFRRGMKTIEGDGRVKPLESDLLTHSLLGPLLYPGWRAIDQVPNRVGLPYSKFASYGVGAKLLDLLAVPAVKLCQIRA